MLVMTMYPTTDMNATDKNTRDVIACAQKLEQGIFDAANTHSEYHKLLIEMIKNVPENEFGAKTD